MHFNAPVFRRRPTSTSCKGMVSIFFCRRMQARQTRDIRIVPMFGNVPVNTYQRIGAVSCARFGCSIVGRRPARQGRQPLLPWLLHR